jgi:aminoglycoside/choline kinase family phosphotransferase
MDSLGFEIVLSRYIARQPVTDRTPYPEQAFIGAAERVALEEAVPAAGIFARLAMLEIVGAP